MMKLKKKWCLCMTFIITITACYNHLSVANANAITQRAIKLVEGKTYSYDLDMDGKKEKIRYVVKENNVDKENDENWWKKRYQYCLYINGKKQFNDTSYSNQAKFELCDVNKNDKSIELFFISPYASAAVSLDNSSSPTYFFQYKKSNLKKVQDLSKIFQNNKYKDKIAIHSDDMYDRTTIYSDNKGTIAVFLCSYGNAIGHLHMQGKLELKNGKFRDMSKGNFTLLDSDINDTKVTKPFNVYKSAGSKSIAFKTKKNTSIYAKSIKFINGKGYVQILHNKKLGWIGIGQSDISYKATGALHV